MKYTGRVVAIGIALFFHLSLMLYYFYRDGIIEKVDLLSSPFLILASFWAGKQYDKAKYYSDKDVITGLYNRRYVQDTFKRIKAAAERNDRKLFILVMDCDNFKDINDLYGHSKGDMVLSRIGSILAGMVRKCDIAARWGGDEFLLIVSYEGEKALQAFQDTLEGEIRSLSRQIKVPVMVSIGTAIYPHHSGDLFELIKAADDHMYNNKWTKRGYSKP
jgi:diguanylate cyclase (GGDEF)-like protein